MRDANERRLSANLWEAWVSGSTRVYGAAVIRCFDEIEKTPDYLVIQGFREAITVTANSIHAGCKTLTPDELDHEQLDWPSDDVARAKAMIEIALDRILEQASHKS